MDEIRYDLGDDPVEVARKIVLQYGLRTCVTGDRVEAVISRFGSVLMLPGSRLSRWSENGVWLYDYEGPAVMVPTNPSEDPAEALGGTPRELGNWLREFIEAGQRLCDESGCGDRDCCDAAIAAEQARVAFKALRMDYEAFIARRG